MNASKTPAQNAPLHVHVLCRILWNGDTIIQSLIEPEFASYGEYDESLETMRLFLEEHLKTISATKVSQYKLPAEATLDAFRIEVQHPTLPKRLQKTFSMDIPCVVVPLGADVWIHIVPLTHIFYAHRDEVLAESVQNEVQRILSVRESDPEELLSLFPDRNISLERLEVERAHSTDLDPIRTANWRKTLSKKYQEREAIAVLESVADPLHKQAQARSGPELVHRTHEQHLTRTLLSGSTRNGVLFVGARGSGKSALMWDWLRNSKDPSPRVYATSGARLVAGMSGLGQWQERIHRVSRALEVLGAVLYLDDIADLFTENERSSIDIPSTLKAYLDRGQIRILSEVTPESLDRLESRNVGFFNALIQVRLKPFDAAQSAEVLRVTTDHWRARHPKGPLFTREAQSALVSLCSRYIPYGAFPGKVVAYAGELYNVFAQSTREHLEIEAPDVYNAFAKKTGVPVFLLREDTALKLHELQEQLQTRVIGQREAVQRVAETLCVVKARLQPGEKPLSVFLFAGPTGVGKTELARSLARVLFGDEERIIRFDMSEFTDALASHRLIQGLDRDEGLLTRAVRRQPFSVLLLDEVEKAHPAVFDLLLQVCGEGRLTDIKGKTVYFNNTIIIMTSNLGALASKRSMGIGARVPSQQERYESEIVERFRPEFVNRLDRVVVFHALSRVEISEIIHIFLSSIRHRRGLVSAGIQLVVSEKAIDWLADQGCSPEYGARALRRVLDTHIATPVAHLVAAIGLSGHHSEIHVQTVSESGVRPALEPRVVGALRITITAGHKKASRHSARSVQNISDMRRTTARLMTLYPVQSVREKRSFLQAQMNYGVTQGDVRVAQEIASLQAEYHRLDQLYQTAQSAVQEIEELEELCVIALLQEEVTEGLAGEVHDLERAFRRSLLPLLVAEDAVRDNITLMVTEPDEGQPNRFWLVPFLKYSQEKGWAVTLHFLREENAEVGDPSWPEERLWGPPRGALWCIDSLEKNPRRVKRVLVRVSGPYAASLLSLECGVHRWEKVSGFSGGSQMICSNMGLFSDLKASDWDDPALASPEWASAEEVSKRPAVRVYSPADTVQVAHKVRKVSALWSREAYWDVFDEVALTHLLLFLDPPEGVHLSSRGNILRGEIDRAKRARKEKKERVS